MAPMQRVKQRELAAPTAAANALAEQYLPLASNFIKRAKARDRSDLKSNVHYALVLASRDFDPARGPFSSWAQLRMWQICRQIAKTPGSRQLRREKQLKSFCPTAPAVASRQAEIRELTHLAMHELSDRQRKVIRMRFWGGMSVDQIGIELGITHQRASQLIKQALDGCRRELGIEMVPSTGTGES